MRKTQAQYERERLARAKFWEEHAFEIWRETHPQHTAADFEHWGSCRATTAQAAEFERWVFKMFDPRMLQALKH